MALVLVLLLEERFTPPINVALSNFPQRLGVFKALIPDEKCRRSTGPHQLQRIVGVVYPRVVEGLC